MEDLFRSYWWLIFPLAWFLGSGWSSWMRYRRQRDTLDLIRTYAEKGQEPPAELLRVVGRPDDDDDWGPDRQSSHRENRSWPWPANVVLFALLGAGFAYATHVDLYGAGEAFTIVTFVMGAMAVAFLVAGIFSGRNKL